MAKGRGGGRPKGPVGPAPRVAKGKKSGANMKGREPTGPVGPAPRPAPRHP